MREICVLSLAEAGRLEHYGRWPLCKDHKHIKKADALRLVAEYESHRFIGGPDTQIKTPVTMIVAVNTTRLWQPVPTAGLMGFRTWGLQRQL